MIAGETLWVYKRTIELNGKTGFQQVMEPLYAQMVTAGAAEDPTGKSANNLGVFDYFSDPISVGGGSEPNHPPLGTELARECDGTTLKVTLADGNGGSTVVETPNSAECGYVEPDPDAGNPSLI
jgi:hypothetical protein